MREPSSSALCFAAASEVLSTNLGGPMDNIMYKTPIDSAGVLRLIGCALPTSNDPTFIAAASMQWCLVFGRWHPPLSC